MNPFQPYLISICVVLLGCQDTSHQSEQLQQELDEVKKELHELKAQIQEQQDTLSHYPNDSDLSAESNQEALGKTITVPKEEKVIAPDPKIKAPEPKPKEEKLTLTADQEELFYYKNSKKLSLRITPWKDDRRQLIFYDKEGQISYTQDDVRLSYHEITEVLAFHDNGAVAKIQTHLNPGASRHWSEADIIFDDDNYPLRKFINTYPIESLTQDLNNTFKYDRFNKNWVPEQNR